MAPEQLQGKATYTSDQYSLGIVLYEWLTGQLPFKGSFAEIGSQHLFTPPPALLGNVPNMTPAVEQVLQKALAKDPQQRFGRVQDFVQALEMASQGNDPTYVIQKSVVVPDQAQVPTFVPSVLNRNVSASGTSTLQQNIPTPPPNSSFQSPVMLPPPFGQVQSSFPRSKSNKGYFAIITMLVVLMIFIGFFVWYRPFGSMNTPGTSHSSDTQISNQSTNQGKSSNVQIAPTLTAPSPGTVLYQEDGSDNWAGWIGTSDWKILNKQLLNDGSSYPISTASNVPTTQTITPPYQVKGTSDYAVEAKITIQHQQQDGPTVADFQIGIRCGANGDPTLGYHFLVAAANAIDNQPTGYIQDANAHFQASILAKAPFDPGTVAYTYRIEVKGNDMKVLIDGYLKVETKDNQFLTGSQVGLSSNGDELTVNSFTIIAL